MPDDLQTLRALGASLDVPPDDHVSDVRARVLTTVTPTTTPGLVPATADGLRGPSRWRGGRPARVHRLPHRLAVAGGLAAAVAAAVTVATLAVPSGGTAPDGRGPIAASGTGAPTGGESGAGVLRLAARAVTAAPGLDPRPDQFVYTESVTVQRIDAGPVASGAPDPGEVVVTPPLGPPRTLRQQEWRSADGTREGLVRTAGAPDVQLPGCVAGVETIGGQPCRPDPGHIRDLPADPAGILALLRARYTDVGEFPAAGELLAHGYLPPATRAALFEALATLDGVEVLDDLTDAAGRHGVAVTRTSGGFRGALIFDPSGYALLGFRSDVVAGNAWNWPAGVTWYTTALLRTAVVDRPGELP
ncbi:CU044_5270 family protein [Dactylosporangium sp. NPDC049525]|uniref:CU044_5270 family protein n=1 Tax=Dactylosporangium sp. NPDC049525 TaxID=3154730 RepID=UPI0034185402